MAEALLTATFPDKRIESAGLAALIGCQADPKAIELMQARGFDLTLHRARQLNATMCSAFDLLLVMDKHQKQALEKGNPSTRGKVYRICESMNYDVPDPFRQDMETFEKCFSSLEQGAIDWIGKIRALR